jgi:outer membrane protein TolC
MEQMYLIKSKSKIDALIKLCDILTLITAFLIPLKLSLTYVTVIPNLLLWLTIFGGHLGRYFLLLEEFFIFIFLAGLSSLYGANTLASLKGLLSLLAIGFWIPIVAEYTKRNDKNILLYSLIYGQFISSTYTVLTKIAIGRTPQLFLGEVTQSGQLALTIFICIALIDLKNYDLKIISLSLLTILALVSLGSLSVSLNYSYYTLTFLIPTVLYFIYIFWRTFEKGKLLNNNSLLLLFLAPPIVAALILNLKRGPWFGILLTVILLSHKLKSKIIIPISVGLGTLSLFSPIVRMRLLNMKADFFIAGGRSEIWSLGKMFAYKYPLGIGYENGRYISAFSEQIPPDLKHFHNNLINLWVEVGFIPTLFLIIWLIKIIKLGLSTKDQFVLLLTGGLISWQIAGVIEYNFGDSEVVLIAFLIIGIIAAKKFKLESINSFNKLNNKKCFLLTLLIGLFFLSFNSLQASDLKDICQKKLSLNQFKAYALKNSPSLKEIDRDYINELANAFNIETLENPDLQVEKTFTTMNIGGANDPQTQISLGQPIRISNFGIRSRVAELIRKYGNVEKQVKVFKFIQLVSIEYQQLYVAEKSLQQLEEAVLRASKKLDLIKEGVKKGLFSKGDESLFKGEKYLLKAQLAGMKARVASLKNEIYLSLGVPCILHTLPPPTPMGLPTLADLENIASRSKISAKKRIDIFKDLTEEQLKLAESDALPKLTPLLVYQHTNDGGDFFGAAISIPLPIWYRNEPERARAKAEVEVANLKAKIIDKGGHLRQIATLRSAAESASEQAKIFAEEVVPSFKEALFFQEKLYEEGKGNILQVWQTLRAYNQVQAQGLELWLIAARSRTELSILIGEEL